MALTDYERAWQKLEAYVTTKPAHGHRELVHAMTRFKAECAEDESFPERAFRLYGVQLHEDLRRSARDDLRDPPVNNEGGSPAFAVPAMPAHRHNDRGGHDASNQDPCRTTS